MTTPIDVIVDKGVGSVYLGLHDLLPEEDETACITMTMEKHGIILHWNGHGKLTGVQVKASGRPIHVLETDDIEGNIP